MALKDYAYTNTPLDFQVLLDGVDISDAVKDIPSVQGAIDFPQLLEYRVGECQIVLNDPTGFYGTLRSDNFYTGRGQLQSGLGVSVEVKAGYESTLETLFVGEITKITAEVDAETAYTRLIGSDKMHQLFTTEITNFGLEKHFRLTAETDDTAINGRYPLPVMVQPVSKGSVTLKKSVSDTLTEVPTLATRGALDADNYTVGDAAIETEGGEIEGVATGYPQVELKAPYRHISVKLAMERLLDHIGVTQRDIEIPKIAADPHFTTLGRIGYDLVGRSLFGSSNTLNWQGYVTDAFYDAADQKYYFLYSPPRSATGLDAELALLFRYDRATETSELLWRAATATTFTTEAWKMAKNGDVMAILLTDAGVVDSDVGDLPDVSVPRTGSYNAAESGNSVYIVQRDLTLPYTDSTVVTLVHKNSPLKPQLAHRYILGQTYSDPRAVDAAAAVPAQSPPYELPDSRRKMVWHNNLLHYVYVDANNVGVARVSSGNSPAAVTGTSIARDRQGNEMGMHFSMRGNDLFVLANFKGQDRSRAMAWQI